MIDENLSRADLTTAQVSEVSKRRKEIYEAPYPEMKAKADATAARKTSDNLSFVSATASATGMNRRTIERAVARADALGDGLKAVQGTSLDKGTKLDALVRMRPEDRRAVVEQAKAGAKVSAVKLADDALNDFKARERQVAAIIEAWNKASAEARGSPVAC